MAANVMAEAITDEVHKDLSSSKHQSIVGRKSTIHEHPFMKEVSPEEMINHLIITDELHFSSLRVVWVCLWRTWSLYQVTTLIRIIGCCIWMAVISVEVLKVRLQLANATVTTSQSVMNAGLFETGRKVYQKEGVRAFYSGLMPAIVRGLFYGGVRLGIDSTIWSNRSLQKPARCVI